MKRIAVALLLVAMLGGCAEEARDLATNSLDQATRTQFEAGLRNAAVAAETYFTTAGTYEGLGPGQLQQRGFNPIQGVTFSVPTATAADYCIEATNGGVTMHLSRSQGSPAEGTC